MPDPRQGEVYQWPTSGSHPMGVKTRLWVVVSRDVFNKHSSHVLICPLTSYPATPLDIPVQATPHNPLSHDSSLLPRMITPVLKDRLGPCLGRLSRTVLSPVLDRLRMIIEA